jgi:hypothetical protein
MFSDGFEGLMDDETGMASAARIGGNSARCAALAACNTLR